MMLSFGIILLMVSQIFAFNTYDCGATKNCLSAHDSATPKCNLQQENKDASDYCHFAMSYRLLEDEPDYVMIELRRPRYNDTLMHQMVYVAMGLSTDETMGNDSVVQCYFNESASFNDRRPFEVFLSWNENFDNGTHKDRNNVLLPTEYEYNNTEHLYNIQVVSGLITETMYSCTFKRRIRPVISHINPEWHDFWDLNDKYYIFMAYGNVNHETGRLFYHGPNKVILGDKTNLVAKAPLTKKPEGCESTKRCFGVPRDCDMNIKDENDKKYCRARLYVTPEDTKDGTVTMELYATRINQSEYGGGQSYVAAGFSKSGGMLNASVVHCVFRDDGNYARAFQSYNFEDGGYRANKVLPEEIGNATKAQNVQFVNRKADDNYFGCTLKRKVKPLMELSEKFEIFPLDENYTLIMAWGRAMDAMGGEVSYHFTNRGIVSDPIDVTQPIPPPTFPPPSKTPPSTTAVSPSTTPKGGRASTKFLSLLTSLFAIGVYILLKN